MEWDDPGAEYINRAIKELGIKEDPAFRAFADANLVGTILKGQNELVDQVMTQAWELRKADEAD